MRLFISHAVADKKLVDAVITLLEMGMGISSKDIFCSSFDEQGIPPGADFSPYMRERLQKADAILAIVSPQYYESPFCLCETGGAWAIEKTFLPLLVEPVDFSDLRGALYGKQGLLISSGQKLDAMRDSLSFLGDSKTTRWNRKKEEFLKSLPKLLKALKPVEVLKGKELKKLQEELGTARQEAADLDSANEDLQSRVDELEKLKDAKAVKAIRKKYSSEDQQFDDLLDKAKDAIEELPAVAREAMRFYLRKDYFNPKREQWGDEVEDAIQRDYLNASDDSVALNDDHPDVETALHAWNEFSEFVEGVSDKFQEQYRKEHKKTFSITSLPFWEDHELL
jgi:hypothetical protein